MKEPVIVLIENTSYEKLVAQDKALPSDTHFVRYRKPTWKKKEKVSAIRAFKKIDIFDHLHDQGFEVLEITSGHGTIRPNCFTSL